LKARLAGSIINKSTPPKINSGKGDFSMERYGEFITSDEDKLLLHTIRDYIDKGVMLYVPKDS